MSELMFRPDIVEWCEPVLCCDERWEDAYKRFETPEEERKKFLGRLRAFGVESWDRSLAVLEIFCGTGNALHAWSELGFTNIEGVDLSRRLLESYRGTARLYLGDCRDLRLPDSSKDVIAVQGGMHHLPDLQSDLPRVLDEVSRVLRPGGRFLVVEPWWTPFLRIVHCGQNSRLLRALWPRYDALATMTEQEASTYFRWLAESEFIKDQFSRRFQIEQQTFTWGKWRSIGRRV